jgi:hypothetical protein
MKPAATVKLFRDPDRRPGRLAPTPGLLHISEFIGQIQRGIPIPPKKNGPAPLYPLRNLKVGESFFVAQKKNPGSFYEVAKQHRIKISVRRIGTGMRVWRVA